MSRAIPSVDILLCIALKEEFDVVIEMLGDAFRPRELADVALTGFFGNLRSTVLGRNFQLAVFPSGKMGNTRSANVASTLIEKLNPTDVVILGIAGSLTNDLMPGDVFVPDSVNEYLANSATKGDGNTWMFETSGNHFQTSLRLLNRFQMFSQVQKDIYSQWRCDTKAHWAELIQSPIRESMVAAGLEIRTESEIYVGDDRKLASGPAVGKGEAFLEWLKREVDRKVAALEMESAGVYDAAIIRTPAPRTIAIRGISDYADSRKEKIETSAKGLFRVLAAKNALSLLIRGIEAGIFQPDPISHLNLTVSSQVIVSESRVKSVLVIGGVTDETSDAEAELPRLHNASLKVGRALASGGAQLVICSPFPDSADYYAAMGYAEGGGRGIVHLHSPSHPRVTEKRQLLTKTLGRKELTIQEWNHPGPENDEKESWAQAWLLAQLQALEKADAVVALGGKVSKTANTLLHLAEAKGLPIIPFTFLGGAAKRAFGRRDWKRLNPSFDSSILEEDAGVDRVIEIANGLVADQTARAYDVEKAPRSIFVSYSHKDLEMANGLIRSLRHNGLDVLTGDDQIRPDQIIPVSIEQALIKSDICAILWSQNYALSPWCNDELTLAVERYLDGKAGIWVFNLDDSMVVPSQARSLPTISVRNPAAIERVAGELLSNYPHEH